MKNFLRTIIFLSGISLLSACNSIEIPENIAKIKENLPEKIDYNRHIKPILSDRCFKCHGPDKSKIEAGLQLTSYDEATKKLKSGKRAVDAGDIGDSELVKRILSHDPEEMMPTPKSNLSLSDEEKALLIKWIEQGAEFKEHWAYVAPEKPDVPKIGTFFSRLGLSSHPETDWAKNEIDNFVIEKLKENKLNFSKQADKATLLRRVSMDLTGLPPTVAEVEAFLKDNSTDAYEKAVDRLLNSPHYGENMATSWLDVARYADTHGYQDDGFRVMYPYRDWVIGAFNKNLSYDNFVTYQLAGDLVEKPSRETILATAFNRNHQQSQEGGIVPEEYHTEYVADRVNTFGKAFLGLTTECARCHDHKYDPISQKDYYSLYAFFNNNNEYGQIPYNGEPSPTIILTDEKAEKQLKFIREKLAPHQANLNPNLPKYQQNFEKWLKTAPKTWQKKGWIGHYSFDNLKDGKFKNLADTSRSAHIGEKKKENDVVAKIVKGKVGNGVELIGDCIINYGNFARYERYAPYSFAFWVKNLKAGNTGRLLTNSFGIFDGNRGYELILEPDGTLRFAMSHVWPDDCLDLQTTEKLPTNQWTHVAVSYDGSSKVSGVNLYLNGKKLSLATITDNLNQSTIYGEGGRNWAGWNLSMNMGRWQDIYMKDFQVDEFHVFNKKITPIEVESLYKNTDEIAGIFNNPKRFQAEKSKLLEYYAQNFDHEYNTHTQRASDLICEENLILTEQTETMVFKERKFPRKTFSLKRGSYDAPDKEVSADFISKFADLSDDYSKDRMGLAQWLLDEENPLFARVAVNRFWIQFFGNGLVKTQEDFGNQGEMPSHPELLDWLAWQFREDDWDTKKFIKRIVMSATYQQSSVASQKLLEFDPDNKWLARGPSYRLSAEQVRDNALAASGLLNRKIGGKYVYPYQPEGIWEALATRNATVYVQSKGDSIYRRSLYTVWKRSSPPPMMLNFDVPERSFCTVRRQKTSTPLQALVTMNDPQFVEASRVLAEKVFSKFRADEGFDYIFKSIISRPARKTELDLIKKLYNEEYQEFKKSPQSADELLSVGLYPKNEKLDKASVAAMTMVCNMLFNYDEAIMKR